MCSVRRLFFLILCLCCYLRSYFVELHCFNTVVVFAQAGNYTFNRAKLMNVGFREAMREEDWDCLFFHDVDLIPEDDRNTYVCESNPKHAVIAMDKFGYKCVVPCTLQGLYVWTPFSISFAYHCFVLLFFFSPDFHTKCTLEA